MLRVRHYCFPFLLLCLLAGCESGGKREPSIGEAFVGPATLTLRQDLGPRPTMVGSANHGDRLEIVAVKRRFVKVRTAKGVEGWTDSRLLLSPEQMAEIVRFSNQSSNRPSQGKATVYVTLNIHIAPNRQSSWFTQVKEGQHVDVLARRLAPRLTGEPKSTLVLPAQKPASRKPSKPSSKVPPPDLPKPPKPPPNWLELSKSVLPPEPTPPPPPPKPVPIDDWSLVRTEEGKVGWVLSRMLVMSIPDEVAQYSEGRRITSYFALGTVQDEDKVRHHWVWTTLSDNEATYDFDGFRVFIWSLRHHRYETAYIERNLKGYYPAESFDVKTQYNKKPITAHGFSVIAEGPDGALYRRTFALIGYLIYPVDKTRYEPPSEGAIPPTQAPAQETQTTPAKPSLYERAKQTVKHWFSK